MPISEYLKQVKQRVDNGISTEHSYRSDLQVLLNDLIKGITVTNEPKRQKCGAPDYIIQHKEVPLGYIEAKDIGVDLDKTEKSDQMKRYLGSLDNLILTDYLEFRFYRYGNKINEIKVASIEMERLLYILTGFLLSKHISKTFMDSKDKPSNLLKNLQG